MLAFPHGLGTRSWRVRGHGIDPPQVADRVLLNALAGHRCLTRHLVVGTLLAAITLAFPGCGKPEPAVDSEPLKVAIEQYLQHNDMLLRIKEIKQGPTITGTRATMSVSLTHAELGGPSVVWEFQFEQEPGGVWHATSHHD